MNLEKARAAAARKSDYTPSEQPAAFAAVPASRTLDLDVRDDLRRGVEPFSRIMQEQAKVGAGDVLRVRAIFEPVPLYHVLGRQGFTHWTEKLADDDWRIWFLRGSSEPDVAERAAPTAQPSDADMIELDVRGLEPPEPMVRTLEALERLPEGKVLVQVNVRVPQMLLPLLAERGFEYVLVSETPNEVRGLIRRQKQEG
jgi:TusA-related sulfurtransferase